MLQNPWKTLGFKKNMVYKIPLGGGKPYPASGLLFRITIPYMLSVNHAYFCKSLHLLCDLLLLQFYL